MHLDFLFPYHLYFNHLIGLTKFFVVFFLNCPFLNEVKLKRMQKKTKNTEKEKRKEKPKEMK